MSRISLLAWVLPFVAFAADTPQKVSLTPGQTVTLGNLHAPICDNPKVAVLSAEGGGHLTATGVGKTLCSGTMATGQRQLFEVTVEKKKDK